jgi:TetR/AcrR family transcriptional regulator, acrAB operon repressor
MARRTKEEAAITREQLLDAAERIFRENGVTRTSLAEVAQAAGVTRGAVYWHFRDKADLFTAMCERATLPLDAALERAAVAGVNDPLGMLRTLAITALTRLATDARSQAVFEVIFHKSELTDELATIAERKQCGQRECLLQVERVVRQAVVAGQLPVDTDTALATQALHAFMTGIMHEWVGNKAAYDLAAAAPAFIDMILAGLQADPPRRKGRVFRRVRKAAPLGARRRKSSRPLSH